MVITNLICCLRVIIPSRCKSFRRATIAPHLSRSILLLALTRFVQILTLDFARITGIKNKSVSQGYTLLILSDFPGSCTPGSKSRLVLRARFAVLLFVSVIKEMYFDSAFAVYAASL